MTAPVRLLLVSMPFAPPQRPSLALGLLKTLAMEAGIGTEVLFPCLDFVEAVGFEDHQLLTGTACEEGLIEWLFAPLAFPDAPRDDARFMERFLARNPSFPVRNIVRLSFIVGKARRAARDLLDTVVARIVAAPPAIVGCTSMFQQHVASLALLRRLKAELPDILTMMGGPNCETRMGLATHANFPWVDYVVSGEAEDLFAPLLLAMLRDGRAVGGADLAEGVFAPRHRVAGYPASKAGDGAPRATVSDFTKVPLPDFSDYFQALDHMPSRARIVPSVPIETARGCWWGMQSHCTFCGLNGTSMTFRSKAAERVVAEIETQLDRYGVANMGAVDNIIDLQYFDSVLPELARRGSTARLFYETKSNLKRRHLRATRAANVVVLQPGIESLSSAALKHMGKGVQAWQNIQFLRFAAEAGVRTVWTSLIGFPEEDDGWHAEAAALFPLLTHLEPGGVSRVRYDRYSPLFKRALESGAPLRPFEGYQHIYPLSGADLFDQCYFFEAHDSPADAEGRWEVPVTRWADGAGALALASRAWKMEWHRGRPVCAMIETPEGLVVEDSRACAVRAEHRPGLVGSAILRAADDAPAEHRLRATVAQALDVAPAVVDVALCALEDARLLLRIDGRVVALPTLGQARAPVPNEEHPLGMILAASEKNRVRHIAD